MPCRGNRLRIGSVRRCGIFLSNYQDLNQARVSCVKEGLPVMMNVTFDFGGNHPDLTPFINIGSGYRLRKVVLLLDGIAISQ